MSDLLLRHTPNGGDFKLSNGRILLDESLSTAFYISLFGGNEEDNGDSETQDDEYWANKIARVPERSIRSKTQSALAGTEARSSNRAIIENAALDDLQWAVSGDYVENITATVTIPAPKMVRLKIDTRINGQNISFVFDSEWGQD